MDMNKNDWQSVTFLLRKDTYKKLLSACKNDDRPLSYYLRILVEKHLQDIEK